MKYISTRGGTEPVSAAQAIVQGLAADGGLFVPQSIPKLGPEDLMSLVEMDYRGRAEFIMNLFAAELPLEQSVKEAYRAFEPQLTVLDGPAVLELWHGPTCAFKDIALQILPRLLVASRQQVGMEKDTLVVVATSGDTGSAALSGFADVPHTRVAVYYPRDGVSAVQRLQMENQEGKNLAVIAVEGNFDDAQTGVKEIFADEALKARIAGKGYELSSANSINWGRLMPQIVYYFSAWCDMYRAGKLKENEPLDFVVPTGNFGNILAGWYAGKMGLPLGRMVCASNTNRVLTDFFQQGVYDIRRDFHKTISPSMDILISSNLERLLFEASGRDASKVRAWMEQLKQTGRYEVENGMLEQLRELFDAGFADDGQTRKCIARVWEEQHYLLDPHTAVAWDVYNRTGGGKAVIVSTASPFKFAADVLQALGYPIPEGAEAQCRKLEEVTGLAMPSFIARLLNGPQSDPIVSSKRAMAETLLGLL